MSDAYNTYINEHIENVQKAYDLLVGFIPEIAEKMGEKQYFFSHDSSKWSAAEYKAYDKYFYGGNRSYEVVQDFKYAWLHHIHDNPHHWQYWVLQHDDEPEEALEMPYPYAIEMICDWWSFSVKSGNLTEIFSWYEKHKGMKLHPKTRKLVENILGKIKTALKEKSDESH